MKKRYLSPLFAGVLIGLALLACGARTPAATNEVLLHFDRLTIKGKTYTNLTVTSRETNYIFVVHAGGMENIKLVDIPRDLRRTLGYGSEPAPRTSSLGANLDLVHLNPFSKRSPEPTNAIAAATNTAIEPPASISQWEPATVRRWRAKYLPDPDAIGFPVVAVGSALAFLSYLFFCSCCRLLCIKAGTQPGVLIWLPLLKVIPLLQAAGMSPWWFLLWLIPVLNLVVWVVWSVNIVRALGRSPILVVLLLLPLVNALTLLYLAFAKPNTRTTPK
jgi:hypothetical protein